MLVSPHFWLCLVCGSVYKSRKGAVIQYFLAASRRSSQLPCFGPQRHSHGRVLVLIFYSYFVCPYIHDYEYRRSSQEPEKNFCFYFFSLPSLLSNDSSWAHPKDRRRTFRSRSMDRASHVRGDSVIASQLAPRTYSGP